MSDNSNKHEESFSDVVMLMSKDDRVSLYNALDNYDYVTVDDLFQKYGYMTVRNMALPGRILDNVSNVDTGVLIERYKKLRFSHPKNDDYINDIFNKECGHIEVVGSISELMELDSQECNSKTKKILDAAFSEKIRHLNTALELLCKAGCVNAAKDLFKVLNEEYIDLIFSNMDENIIKKEAISNRAKLNGSKNEHKERDAIINVMRNTWSKYPCMSQNRIIEKIREKFSVSQTTLKFWIKEYKLLPEKPEKYTDGELVLCEDKN